MNLGWRAVSTPLALLILAIGMVAPGRVLASCAPLDSVINTTHQLHRGVRRYGSRRTGGACVRARRLVVPWSRPGRIG